MSISWYLIKSYLVTLKKWEKTNMEAQRYSVVAQNHGKRHPDFYHLLCNSTFTTYFFLSSGAILAANAGMRHEASITHSCTSRPKFAMREENALVLWWVLPPLLGNKAHANHWLKISSSQGEAWVNSQWVLEYSRDVTSLVPVPQGSLGKKCP